VRCSSSLLHHSFPLPPDATLRHFIIEFADDDPVFMAFAVEAARDQLPRFESNRASILYPLEDFRVVGPA
jgi:hypothetical protein